MRVLSRRAKNGAAESAVGEGGSNWPAADVRVMLFACFSTKDKGHYRRQHMPINKAGSMEGNIDKGRGSVGVH